MKRLYTTALACAFAVSLAVPMAAAEDPATQGSSSTSQSSQPGSSSDDPVGTSGTASSADTITVTGCLTGSAGKWQLTKAKKSESGSMTSGSSSSTSGSTASGSSASAAGTETYALKATSDDQLKPHVGHKIEVTGTLAESRMASGSTSSTDQPVGTAGAGSAKTLNVTSVKMVSGSCE